MLTFCTDDVLQGRCKRSCGCPQNQVGWGPGQQNLVEAALSMVWGWVALRSVPPQAILQFYDSKYAEEGKELPQAESSWLLSLLRALCMLWWGEQVVTYSGWCSDCKSCLLARGAPEDLENLSLSAQAALQISWSTSRHWLAFKATVNIADRWLFCKLKSN